MWVRARHAPCGEVEHPADLNAAADEVSPRRVDVGDGQDQATNRTRLACCDALPEGDRARRVGGRELDHPEGVTDGPYPQTRELSGGFTLVDVPTREAALAWAAKIAAACRCAQEVREFGPDPELDEMLRQADSRR